MGENVMRLSELYQQLNMGHQHTVLVYHCCWKLRNALGSKVQYSFSSLLECLEIELTRSFHLCQQSMLESLQE